MDGKTRLSRDLRIRLFGGPVLEYRGRPLDVSPFHGVLLSILAYHGRRGIRRDRLLSFLWPAGPEGALRRRLSQVVYSMHQRIGVPELVIMAGDRFFLDVDRVAPDLETFHTALQERRLEEALALLDLEFLAEVNPVPTPDLEVWIAERIRQFRSDFRTAGARLWGESEQRGDWERASRTAELLLRLDPSDEEVLRKVIRAHGLTGHVAEARAIYREFSERMESLDLDWAPASETTELLSRLDTLARERGPTFLVGRYGLPEQPPLVGREEELATLGRLLRDPTDGQVAGIGVVGEPGVGKTRLSWEALRTLPFDGVRVLSARCSEFERRIPLALFTSALKPAWVGEAARDLEDPWRAVLLSIFPEWHRDPGPPPAVPDIETSEVPRRLCEALRRLFTELVRTDPVVLFVDDFHWADETSLAALDYIRHRGVDGDLRVLVTVDGSQAMMGGGQVAKAAALRWIDADRTTVRFALPPLTQDQALQLASACAALKEGSLDPAEVVRTAGRNPLLIAEVVNNWDFLRHAEHRGVAGLPPTFQDIIVDPILSLPECERGILNVIALALQPLAAGSLLSHLSASFGSAGDRALGELLRRRLVELTVQGFQPTSALLAWSVVQLMPPPERISICASYARGNFGEITDPAARAHYARECQDFAEARSAYQAAAERAWDRGAGREAVACLSEALEIAPPGEEWEGAQIQLAEGLLRARMFTDAIPHLSRSESVLETRGDTTQAAVHRAHRQGATLLLASSGDDDPARRSLWGTVDAAAEVGDFLPLALGLDYLARHAQRNLDIEGLTQATKRACGLLNRVDDPEARARLLMCCSLQAFAGRGEAGLQAARQAVVYGEATGNVTLLVTTLNRLLMLQGMQGLLGSSDGRTTIERLQALARLSGDLRERLQPRINHGVWLMVTGSCHEALATLLGLSDEISALGDQDLTARWYCNVGIAHLRLGDADSAVFSLSNARDHVVGLSHLEGKAHVLGALGWAFLISGRISRAREIAESLENLTPRPGLDPVMLAGFLARFEARYRHFAKADQILRTAVESSKDSFPVSTMDLIIQRMELLGSRRGFNGWAEDVAWAREFCQVRQLYEKASMLDAACRRAKA